MEKGETNQEKIYFIRNMNLVVSSLIMDVAICGQKHKQTNMQPALNETYRLLCSFVSLQQKFLSIKFTNSFKNLLDPDFSCWKYHIITFWPTRK